MRDPHPNKVKRLRRKRRAVLAVILIAGSPAMAEGPIDDTDRVLLPLNPIAECNHVQDNPFCQPTPSRESAREVQLASGTKSSAIRLKPIGAAIGLHCIGVGQESQNNSPAMTIEQVGPSEVRNNPLVESAHHANRELVEAEVDDRSISIPGRGKPVAVTPIAAPTRAGRSSIILVPPAEIQPPIPEQNVPPLIHAGPIAAPAAVPPTIAPPMIAPPMIAPPMIPPTTIATPTIATPPAMIPPAIAVQAAPVANDAPPAPVEDTDAANDQDQLDPVYFSMSDRFDPQQAPQTSAADAQRQPAQSETAQGESVAADLTPEPEALASGETVADAPDSTPDEPSVEDESSLADASSLADERSLPQPVNIAADGSVQLGVAEPIELEDEANDAGLKPMESVIGTEGDTPIAIYHSEPALVQLAETPEATLQTKRYRPPVAVKPVPIAFERASEETQPSVTSTVQSVQAPNLDGLGGGNSSKLTPLYMSRAQVRSLTLGGEIRGIKVADDQICRAIAAGPNQLKLIGTGNGVTRLVVWADADDVDAPTRMRTFEIHVKEAVSGSGDAIGKNAQMLNQSIRQVFPQSSVRVRADRGQLIVTGRCDSEASAKQIIRMVRKACLVPVQDNLLVR